MNTFDFGDKRLLLEGEYLLKIEDLTVGSTIALELQPRIAMDNVAIRDWALQMESDGVYKDFPPIEVAVITDHDDELVIIDGRHRYMAARDAGLTEVHANVRLCTYREADIAACLANFSQTDHVRLTTDDKVEIYQRLMKHDEYASLTRDEIAKVTKGVLTPSTITAIRKRIIDEKVPSEVMPDKMSAHQMLALDVKNFLLQFGCPFVRTEGYVSDGSKRRRVDVLASDSLKNHIVAAEVKAGKGGQEIMPAAVNQLNSYADLSRVDFGIVAPSVAQSMWTFWYRKNGNDMLEIPRGQWEDLLKNRLEWVALQNCLDVIVPNAYDSEMATRMRSNYRKSPHKTREGLIDIVKSLVNP